MKALLLIFSLLMFSLQAQEVPKAIVLEHFTNTNCGICASNNPTLYNTIDNYPEVVHLAIHPSSPYPSCEFNQHNPSANDARTNYYGIFGGTPRVVLNGEVVPQNGPLITDSKLQSEQALTTPYSLNVSQTVLGSDSLEVSVTVSTVAAATTIGNARLYIAIAEKEVQYNAPNGENVHFDVFRKALTMYEGNAITLPSQGMSVSYTFKTIIDQEWDASELTSTVILQNGNTKEILQGVQSEKLNSTVDVKETIDLSNAFYPNPANDFLQITNPDFAIEKVEIYNIIGSLLMNSYVADLASAEMNLTDLEEGNYILRLYDKAKGIHTRKLVVKH